MKQTTIFTPSKPKSYLITAIWLGVLIFGAKFVIKDALPYFGFDPEVFGRFLEYKWALIGHVSGGLLAITIGPFQFWKAFRTKYNKIHRTLGIIYLVAIVIASLSATYLSWTSALAVHWTWAISLQGLAFVWISTVAMAYRAVRLHRYKIHREWMIRSYVVTFGFVTFRWLNELAVSYELGNFIERGPTLIWVCWAIPLFITEMVLQWNKKR
ncbi:hypothetical protein MNBD_BACTEROID02-228 [hydrothermal vent metagenome]|jgi:uncharacterized membrane protein|uniref:DUF2306 domain-containing protein n=1 Tax=hydrothermal vent metagenome TaxID=652676 RepID=A0A3B0R0Y3_9ZZZZ